jgi:hypothetical protein
MESFVLPVGRIGRLLLAHGSTLTKSRRPVDPTAAMISTETNKV